jgi:hypothetical protein
MLTEALSEKQSSLILKISKMVKGLVFILKRFEVYALKFVKIILRCGG